MRELWSVEKTINRTNLGFSLYEITMSSRKSDECVRVGCTNMRIHKGLANIKLSVARLKPSKKHVKNEIKSFLRLKLIKNFTA